MALLMLPKKMPLLCVMAAVIMSGCHAQHLSAHHGSHHQTMVKGKAYIYQCQSIDEVVVTYGDNNTVQLMYDDNKIELVQAVSGSGERYLSKQVNGKRWQWLSKGMAHSMLIYQQNSRDEQLQNCQLK